MGKLGGWRKGAGRKKATHTLAAEKAREFLVNKIAGELDPILTAQIESAKGLYYEEVSGDGTKKIWQREPDVNAGKYLLDQAVGKAKESVDLTSGGKPITSKPAKLMTQDEVDQYLKSKLNASAKK